MLCNWSTRANVTILRGVACTRNANIKHILPILRRTRYSNTRYLSSQLHPASTASPHLFTVPLPVRRNPELTSLTPLHQSPTSAPSFIRSKSLPMLDADHLSPAQISRASAAAIRISVARGAVWDGFHLWHSLQWSAHRYHHPGSTSDPRPSFQKPIAAFVPVDFGRAVSTRLAGHSLLHSLLKAGEIKTAARLAEQMMAYGVELHPVSFSNLLHQLHPSAEATIVDRLRNLTQRLGGLRSSKVLTLSRVMPTDPMMRFAVQLLQGAREHRWQRTAGMYGSIIRVCLAQGEILVASLLLVLLLKDYQLRRACERVANEAERIGATDANAYVHWKVPEAPSRGFRLLPNRNTRLVYQRVAGFLEEHCINVEDPLFPEASQALANVASELRAQRIPHPNLATLIKVLYSYPQCKHNVWVTLPSGEPHFCNAYRYFNEVLSELLSSLPRYRPYDLNTSLPALNMDSYHALLNYSLRSCHSLTLADRLLHHMTQLRRPPLAPNMATYNILLRSCTLMRRNDLAEDVLRVIRQHVPDTQVDTYVPDFSGPAVQRRKTEDRPHRPEPFKWHRRRFRKLLDDIQTQQLTVPQPNGTLEPDNTLLTSYMAHLVATGRPRAAAALIGRVIPELFAYPKLTTSEERIAAWDASVLRGVKLGPYFFAAALNTLRKSGLTSIAERVWRLACAAEARSQEPGSTTSWSLSIHAYTAMLQLYAEEMRRWQKDGKIHDRVVISGCSRTPVRRRDLKRAAIFLQKGMCVFRQLPVSARTAQEFLTQSREDGSKLEHILAPPKADARFYNAALSLVGRHPGAPARAPRQGPHSRWNDMLRDTRRHFAHRGRKPRSWTPELEEVACAVVRAGYALPVGFQLRLVGRAECIMQRERADISARPSSFGRRGRPRFAPHRIPTFKRRGLPVRGRWNTTTQPSLLRSGSRDKYYRRVECKIV
ncbi:hypothetical protein BC834DRAFT_941815 [Gloeopeniophorella convolvens]|nr:hypothetical protein BC834DRAFT_941815 [Gloeopeniophorella convolvens]